MDPMIGGLYVAISGMAGAIGVLFAIVKKNHDDCVRDRKEMWTELGKLGNSGKDSDGC